MCIRDSRSSLASLRRMRAAAVAIQRVSRGRSARRVVGGVLHARRASARYARVAQSAAKLVALQTRFRANRAIDLSLHTEYAMLMGTLTYARRLATQAELGALVRARRAELRAEEIARQAAFLRLHGARDELNAAEEECSRLRGRLHTLLALRARCAGTRPGPSGRRKVVAARDELGATDAPREPRAAPQRSTPHLSLIHI